MRIAERVEMLEIAGGTGAMYPVLVWDDREVVLIDTGLPGQLQLIGSAVKAAGFSLEQITKVIITHQDMDHIGSARALAALGAEILAHKTEAPYIQGEKTLVKIADMEKRLPDLSEGERAFYERIKAGAPQVYIKVDRLLEDGETLGFCGGIEVIHTPGHTPGHIALLLKESGIIVAGDAANITGGVLTGPNPQYTQDMASAQDSFEKLTAFNPAAVVCYHGGLYTPAGRNNISQEAQG